MLIEEKQVTRITGGGTTFVHCEDGHIVSVMGNPGDGCIIIHSPEDENGKRVITYVGGAKKALKNIDPIYLEGEET